MSVSIRVSDRLYGLAKKIAKTERRSISSQIEFWATIGKCALDNPDLPIEFIEEIILSKDEDLSEFKYSKVHSNKN